MHESFQERPVTKPPEIPTPSPNSGYTSVDGYLPQHLPHLVKCNPLTKAHAPRKTRDDSCLASTPLSAFPHSYKSATSIPASIDSAASTVNPKSMHDTWSTSVSSSSSSAAAAAYLVQPKKSVSFTPLGCDPPAQTLPMCKPYAAAQAGTSSVCDALQNGHPSRLQRFLVAISYHANSSIGLKSISSFCLYSILLFLLFL